MGLGFYWIFQQFFKEIFWRAFFNSLCFEKLNVVKFLIDKETKPLIPSPSFVHQWTIHSWVDCQTSYLETFKCKLFIFILVSLLNDSFLSSLQFGHTSNKISFIQTFPYLHKHKLCFIASFTKLIIYYFKF